MNAELAELDDDMPFDGVVVSFQQEAEDALLTTDALVAKYGAEHPKYTQAIWRDEVVNFSVLQGYWEWVTDRLENRAGRFSVEVIAAEDSDDQGLSLGTLEVDADDDHHATDLAQDELWDDRLNVTCFPRFKVCRLGDRLGTA